MHNIPTINPKTPLLHHYEHNSIGRDFIVGDLHGCYDQLMGALEFIQFDKDKDRLFCVGDLIDRGPKSIECANLIYEKWVHPILGNHEDIMIQSLINNKRSYQEMWLYNGGLWYKNEEPQLLFDIAKQFQKLPLIISIGNDEKRFNIVHAELIKYDKLYGFHVPVTDKHIDNWEFDNYEMYDMIWGRHLIETRQIRGSYKLYDTNSTKFYHSSDKLSITYVGHSIVPHRPIQIEQHIYIDTGCVAGTRPGAHKFNINTVLTIASPQEEIFYIYHPGWKTTIKYPFNQIKKYT